MLDQAFEEDGALQPVTLTPSRRAHLDVLAAAVPDVLVVRASHIRARGPRARAAVGGLRWAIHRAAH